jgi:preprotein translocase subunit SecG
VGAFGGAGGTSAFGAKTGDVFTWITVVVASTFVLLSIAANYVFDESPTPQRATPTVTEAPIPAAPAEQAPGPIKVDAAPPSVTPVPSELPAVQPPAAETKTDPAPPVDGAAGPVKEEAAPEKENEAKPDP